MQPLSLGNPELRIEEVLEVAVEKRPVTLADRARRKMQRSFDFLDEKLAANEIIYGVNTGFGLFSGVRIAERDIQKLQVNFLRSHSSGVGAALGEAEARAMILLRTQSLALGHSGVRVEVVETLLEFLNRGITPLIPEQGSVGASGDLAPLAHLSSVLIGEGRARLNGEILSGAEALKKAGLQPLSLIRKEALALVNGTQFMGALGSLALSEAEFLLDLADFIGALSLEAMKGSAKAFDAEIHQVRPHPGQLLVAERLRKILHENNEPSEIARSHETCNRVQDSYSLRCMPQVHGASRDAVKFTRSVLETEINSVTDNPLIFPDSGKILSGGNFHGQYLAIALDLLAIAMAEMASISEQRLQKLINPAFSDLPAFLAPKPGLDSGFMIVQVAAASLVSENKTLTHPASTDSIPTSADKEDHVSMGAWAARKARQVIQNTRRVLMMELLAACQGLDYLRPLKTSPRLEELHVLVRKEVASLSEDRAFYQDLEKLEALLQNRKLFSFLNGF